MNPLGPSLFSRPYLTLRDPRPRWTFPFCEVPDQKVYIGVITYILMVIPMKETKVINAMKEARPELDHIEPIAYGVRIFLTDHSTITVRDPAEFGGDFISYAEDEEGAEWVMSAEETLGYLLAALDFTNDEHIESVLQRAVFALYAAYFPEVIGRRLRNYITALTVWKTAERGADAVLDDLKFSGYLSTLTAVKAALEDGRFNDITTDDLDLYALRDFVNSLRSKAFNLTHEDGPLKPHYEGAHDAAVTLSLQLVPNLGLFGPVVWAVRIGYMEEVEGFDVAVPRQFLIKVEAENREEAKKKAEAAAEKAGIRNGIILDVWKL